MKKEIVDVTTDAAAEWAEAPACGSLSFFSAVADAAADSAADVETDVAADAATTPVC